MTLKVSLSASLCVRPSTIVPGPVGVLPGQQTHSFKTND